MKIQLHHRSPRDFKKRFCERLKAIRLSSGKTQQEMAVLLGVKLNAYSKYEYRTLLPQYLIMRLVEITGHNPWFILTGEPCPFLNSTGFPDLRVVEEQSGSKYHPYPVAESTRGHKA